MMVPLSRNTPRLLSKVNGRKHASDDDHEEPIAKRRRNSAPRVTQNKEDIHAEPASTDEELRAPSPRERRQNPLSLIRKEEDIYAEPASSDEELRAPSPPKPRPSKPKLTTPNTLYEADDLKVPPKKVVKKESRNGLNGANKDAGKSGVKQAADHNKENASSAVPRSSSSSTQQGIFDEMAFGSQGSGKRLMAKTFSSKKTSNIHSRPPSKKAKRLGIMVPEHHKRKGTTTPTEKGKASLDSDNESVVSTWSIDELVNILGPAEETAEESANEAAAEAAKEDDPELRTVATKKASKRRKGSRLTVLHDQLGDWIKDRGPTSSQPDSSAPSEGMDHLKEYLEKLPEEEVEGSCCPLCRAPVNDDDYWDYWKGKEKTVKNQNKFCHAHRTKSAWDEYRSEGYPDITWTDLPQRIRKHRMTLFKILNNERSSGYRDRYEPIALTGNAAAVPTKRKDLPEHVQQELESYALDHHSVYPGYYGPHGRRVITESVMKLLKNEIKNCTDAVVQGSGPATFVQAVLVPEMAVLLIMEDCGVDREEAEEIRERTYELGMLLNEEVEDRVELHDHSDDENEYGVR